MDRSTKWQNVAFWVALLVVSAPCAAQNFTNALSGERLVFVSPGVAAGLVTPEVSLISLGTATLTLKSEEWALYTHGGTAVIASGRNVTIKSGIPGPVVLDFGGLPYAIYLQKGSLLSFEGVSLTGSPNPAPYVNKTSANPYAKYRIAGLAPWPSLTAEPGAQLSLTDSSISYFNPLAQQINCTQYNEKAVFALRNTYPGIDALSVGDEGIRLAGSGQIPLDVSLAADESSAVIGEIQLRYSNVSIACLEPYPADVSDHPTAADHTIAIGLGVGLGMGLPLLVAAIVLALLFMRRQKRACQPALLPLATQKHSTSEDLQPRPAVVRSYPALPPHSAGSLDVAIAPEDGQHSSSDSALRSTSVGSATRAGDLATRSLESTQSAKGVETTRRGSGEPYASLPEVLRTRQGGSLEGVEIGPLLGRGSFGRVYKGRWKGSTVAIKVLEHRLNVQESITRESLLSTSIAHPSVVITYRIATVRLSSTEQAEETPQGRKPQQSRKDSAWASTGVQRDCGAVTAGCCWRETGHSRGGSSRSAGKPNEAKVAAASTLVDISEAEAKGAAASVHDSQGSESSGSGVTAMSAAADLLSADGKPFREEMADDSSEGSADAEEDSVETWMLLEYCDRGALSRAVDRGKLRSRSGEGPDLMRVLMCLLDVASGMAYLHSMGILHGDLKSANVLLKSTATDLRGYHCKIADFGMSRVLDENKTHLSTNTYGTLSYMAPELLREGKLSKESDVYSFGILMWELYAAEHLYTNMSIAQVLYAVAYGERRPQVPHGCPPRYTDIMTACWNSDPAQRPDFEAIIRLLQPLLEEARSIQKPESISSGSTGQPTSSTEPAGGSGGPSASRPAPMPLEVSGETLSAAPVIVSPFTRMSEAAALEPGSPAAAAAVATGASAAAPWPAAAAPPPGLEGMRTSPFAQQQLQKEFSEDSGADTSHGQRSVHESVVMASNMAEIEPAEGPSQPSACSPGGAGIAGRLESEHLQPLAI